MGVNSKQVYVHIIAPALSTIGLYSPAAAQLVLGTGLTESKFEYIDQVESNKGDLVPGPAYGFFQMEMATHDDIWKNYLVYKSDLRQALQKLMCRDVPLDMQLHGNALYGAAMCRIHYLRAPAALPLAGDSKGLVNYWKKFYNTPLGAGTPEKALPYFQQACAIVK